MTDAKWIAVKDEFPPLNKKILVCKGNDIEMFNPDLFPNPSNIIKGFVTHWMPLPSPPEKYE